MTDSGNPHWADDQHNEPRRYAVHLTRVGGSARTIRVISFLGPLKAVYLASTSLRVALGKTASSVEVEDLGPADGVEAGYIIDRMEW